MNAETVILHPPRVQPWRQTARALRAQDWALIEGGELMQWANATGAPWHDFADHWNRLTPDLFMGDGGRYRLRRFGQFETDSDGRLRQLVHGPYEQPRHINPLNGGVQRLFDPLEPAFAQHRILRGVLDVLIGIIDGVEGQATAWNVKLHPYRILAKAGVAGQPTPEGLHRDGVDYVVSMLVRRNNVVGGESTATDAQGGVLTRVTLDQPMQLLILNDARTLHEVTPLYPDAPCVEAYRDVLVIAFTKIAED